MLELIKVMSRHWVLLLLVFILSSIIAIFETVSLTAVASLLTFNGDGLINRLPEFLSKIVVKLNALTWADKLVWIAGILLASTIMKTIFVWGNIVCSAILRKKVVKVYRMQVMKRLMNVSIGYMNRRRVSDMQQVIEVHSDNSVGMIIDSFVTVMPQLTTLIILVVFLFKMSVPLTVWALFFAVTSSVLLGFYARRVRRHGADYVTQRNKFSHIVLDILHGMKVIRIFGREKTLLKMFDESCENFHESFARMMRSTSMIAPLFEVSGVVILAIILIISSRIISPTVSSQEIILVFVLIWVRIIPPVKALNQTRAVIVSRLPSLKQVNQFTNDLHEEKWPSGQHHFHALKEKISFRQIKFNYQSSTKLAINEVSFDLMRGQRLGIVGASGSGKSTLSELLLRFYDPQQGSIVVDGIDLKDIDIVSWRKAIGVVTQDVFLFHDTVRANIAFGNPEASEEQVIRAAQRAHAHEFIMALPQGYATRVGDRGILLSGGQRQRIAIARAILDEPQILIFDEATSALDTESEQSIQEAMEDISKDKTVIIIAHRLSTIETCDYIIALKDGSIQEQGKPKELWNKDDGYFRKIITLQSQKSFD